MSQRNVGVSLKLAGLLRPDSKSCTIAWYGFYVRHCPRSCGCLARKRKFCWFPAGGFQRFEMAVAPWYDQTRVNVESFAFRVVSHSLPPHLLTSIHLTVCSFVDILHLATSKSRCKKRFNHTVHQPEATAVPAPRDREVAPNSAATYRCLQPRQAGLTTEPPTVYNALEVALLPALVLRSNNPNGD
jgi:hypothetical protein